MEHPSGGRGTPSTGFASRIARGTAIMFQPALYYALLRGVAVVHQLATIGLARLAVLRAVDDIAADHF